MTKARDLASSTPVPSTVSTTELGYVDGVTSAIQTQVDSKLATATASSTYQTKAANGLVLINTTSFSGVTSVTLPTNTFSANYFNYKVFVNLTSAAIQYTLGVRVTNSGTPVTSAVYDRNNIYLSSGGGATWTNDSSGDNLTEIWMSAFQTGGGAMSFEVLNPFETEVTLVTGINFSSTSGLYVSGARVETTTSYDSLQFYSPGGGNIAGSISVYGYNK